MKTEKTKPVAEVKQGFIIATIWENKNEKGTRHNVTFARLYRAGKQWKRSASFGADDLPTLAAVAELAAHRIAELTTAAATVES